METKSSAENEQNTPNPNPPKRISAAIRSLSKMPDILNRNESLGTKQQNRRNRLERAEGGVVCRGHHVEDEKYDYHLPEYWKAIVGEMVATCLFVWAGCGAATASNRWGSALTSADLLAISAAFGLAISTLAYGFGHISGGHMNPTVTLAFWWVDLMDWKTSLLYMCAQFFGAFVGALLVWGCTASLVYGCDNGDQLDVCDASATSDGGYGPPYGIGVNQVALRITNACAFLLEAVGTYVLILTVLNAAVHRKSEAKNAVPIAIGWAILIVHLVLVPFTGCGINPARTLGPLVVNSIGGSNRWTRGWWVYFVAPWVGSLFAAWTFQFIFKAPPVKVEQEKIREYEEQHGEENDGKEADFNNEDKKEIEESSDDV